MAPAVRMWCHNIDHYRSPHKPEQEYTTYSYTWECQTCGKWDATIATHWDDLIDEATAHARTHTTATKDALIHPPNDN